MLQNSQLIMTHITKPYREQKAVALRLLPGLTLERMLAIKSIAVGNNHDNCCCCCCMIISRPVMD